MGCLCPTPVQREMVRGGACSQGGTDEMVVHLSEQAPIIDGVLEDLAWENSVPVTGFRVGDEASAPVDKTEVRLVWNEVALYVSFFCHESAMSEIKAEYSGRDSFVWRDECVEVFVDVGQEHVAYYQFAANVKGEMFDLSEDREGKLHFDWNGEWEVQTGVGDQWWCAEFRIPFETLGLSRSPKGDVWRVNFCRCDYAGVKENSAWGPTTDFHNKEAFRKILLW